jgi:cob(I)alamin adenosyltransferase
MHRIYTRQGDRGLTATALRERLGKDHPRVVAYGALYELNAALGVGVAALRQAHPEPEPPLWGPLLNGLTEIQHRLFYVGRDVSQSRGTPDHEAPETSPDHVRRLERFIDQLAAETPPWKPFTLPGGTVPAAHLFFATTVCRRAENQLVALHRLESVPDPVLAWVNRLSDLLFVAARYVNGVWGVQEPQLRDPQDGF